MKSNKKAIVLLSGGLDSASALYFAKSKGFDCTSLIFDYGQRHKREIQSAKSIAGALRCPYQIIKINLPWKGSSLLDNKVEIPLSAKVPKCQSAKEIPNTYVPARNSIFLSFALSYAEAIGAKRIFIGAHAQDYSGYPDCRPKFYRAFREVIRHGTKAVRIGIETPLIHKNKAQIIRLGVRLGVPFGLTWSCYRGGKQPCGKCDSCYYRAKGFKEAGITDPLLLE